MNCDQKNKDSKEAPDNNSTPSNQNAKSVNANTKDDSLKNIFSTIQVPTQYNRERLHL